MKKRIRAFAAIFGIAIMVNGTIAFAGSNYRNKDFTEWNATGTEFVSFTEGPLTFQDKVCYTFTLYGSQRDKASLQYRAGIPDPGIGAGDLLCGAAVKAANTVVGSSRGGTSRLDWFLGFSSKKLGKIGIRMS
ncbi:MAG: hypothetical protein IKQ25_03690 [Lachnospiraceae bacterium]|nr:hypothetical protein [Lachnospiraceae bacterium]